MDTSTVKRLNFRLPDFTRYNWVSPLARQVWEPRIQRIRSCRSELEWKSTAHGIRECSLLLVVSSELENLKSKTAMFGLVVDCLGKQLKSAQPYCGIAIEPGDGQPFYYRTVIGKQESVLKFRKAWTDNNQIAMGVLLGYPACCINFYQKVWVEQRFTDTTWPMAVNTATTSKNSRIYEFGQLPETNLLLRWLGVRAVSHLPCAFDCADTIELGKRFMELGLSIGYVEEMNWLIEMLSWPVEWSALHGIAEIKTPILKISTSSDATAEKHVIQYLGAVYPPEGGQGLVFPYRQPESRHVSDSRSFKRGLANPITFYETAMDS